MYDAIVITFIHHKGRT